MGLFRSIKKAVKKVAKVAIKTAPIWSSFIPGASVAGKFLGAAGKVRQFVQAMPRAGPHHYDPSQQIQLESERFLEAQFVRARKRVGFRGLRGRTLRRRSSTSRVRRRVQSTAWRRGVAIRAHELRLGARVRRAV
jgi:hypothetical protein